MREWGTGSGRHPPIQDRVVYLPDASASAKRKSGAIDVRSLRVMPLLTGVVLTAIGPGFLLNISAPTKLVSTGLLAGYGYSGYIGFGPLLSGLTSLGAGLSTPSHPTMPAIPGFPPGSSMPGFGMGGPMAAAGLSVGTVYCSHCGRPNSVGASFCQARGTALIPPRQT